MTDAKELTKKTCFVVTPIGNADDPIRRHIDGIIKAVIRPALEDKYKIEVAHEMSRIGSINKQVVESIYKSDLVIANLTNKNPNVMYELAFRHCLGKPVIQIAEEGTILPFDIGTERTIPYTNDSQGVLELKDKLIEFEKEIDFDDNKQGPIYDVLKNINTEETIIKMFDTKQSADSNNVEQLLRYMINKVDELNVSMDKNNKMINYSDKQCMSDHIAPDILLTVNGLSNLDDSTKRMIMAKTSKEIKDNGLGRIVFSYHNDDIRISGRNISENEGYIVKVFLDNVLKEYSLCVNRFSVLV